MSKKKYKLGILIQSPIQYHTSFFEYLDKDERFDVHVFYMSKTGVEPRYDEEMEVVLDWDIPVLEGYSSEFIPNMSPLSSKGFLSKINPSVFTRINSEDLDALIVYGYEYFTSWLAFVSCLINRVPVFLRNESEDFFFRGFVKRIVREPVIRALFWFSTAALYAGEYNKRFYTNRSFTNEEVFHVPYSVDRDRFDPNTPEKSDFRDNFRTEHDIAPSTTVFLLASKHRPVKRLRDAIEAFCSTPKDINAAMLILGDGPLRSDLERYADEHKGDRKIVFTGMVPQSDYPSYLATGDVLVLPSRENWGAVINEAIASGLAVICSNQVVGWPDMVKPDRNGLIYPFRDINTLSSQMTSLAKNPDRVRVMKTRSRKLSKDISFKKCADSIKEAMIYCKDR